MTETELHIYFEEKRQIFANPEMLIDLSMQVNRICEVTDFDIAWRFAAIFVFELLCFSLDTPQGRELYLRLLTHIAPYCPQLAEKYWKVFDNQENIINRYNI
jgi:hypothetical protein